MTSGPHTGENPGKKAAYVDDETGEILDSEEARTRGIGYDDANVSHGACPDCLESNLAKWRAAHEERRKRAASESVTDEPEG